MSILPVGATRCPKHALQVHVCMFKGSVAPYHLGFWALCTKTQWQQYELASSTAIGSNQWGIWHCAAMGVHRHSIFAW